jgi:hypothetical protein
LPYPTALPSILLAACGSSPAPAVPGFEGNWIGKDPADNSNISVGIAKVAGSSNRFRVSLSDDATGDWCQTAADGVILADLDDKKQLPINMVWVCRNAAKTEGTYPTTIVYSASNDTINLYNANYSRVK